MIKFYIKKNENIDKNTRLFKVFWYLLQKYKCTFFFVCTVYIHYIAKMIGACIVKVKVLAKNVSPNTNDLYIHYMDKSTGTPPSLEEKTKMEA